MRNQGSNRLKNKSTDGKSGTLIARFQELFSTMMCCMLIVMRYLAVGQISQFKLRSGINECQITAINDVPFFIPIIGQRKAFDSKQVMNETVSMKNIFVLTRFLCRAD